MPVLPTDVLEVRRTRTFTELDMPAGLRATHTTRADTWGRIVVERGYLRYEIVDEDDEPLDGWVLRPGVDGIIAPAQPHRVTPNGEVAFFVAFFRSDDDG